MKLLETGDLAMNRLLVALAIAASSAAVLLAKCHQRFRRVAAGGPTLRMLIAGRAGGPTVVFEAGAGGPLETWTLVQPGVSRFASTISYDRAGNGLSSKGATPRDGRHVASELHTALRKAHLRPPYVLVGHSLGGPYIRIFAGMYPDQVAGLVLVDPTQEALMAWAKARDPKPSDTRKFRPYDEVDCAPLTFVEARESRVPAGVPVVLIAGMGPRAIPGFLTPDLRKEVLKDQEIFYPAKLKFYREWLKNVPGSQLIVTRNSGHGIPYEEPKRVVEAIRQVVNRARLSNDSR